MKFVVSSNAILSRLQAVSRVISGKPIQPQILNNILLVADNGMLTARATDKETTMEAKVEVESMEGSARFTVSAKMLLDILKGFPEQPLTFEVDEASNKVKVISEKGELSVQGESAADYPEPSASDEEPTVFETKCGLMLDGIVKSVFATAADDLRPIMNCILIEMDDTHFTFVASDAHKLVRYKRFDAKIEGEPSKLILPKKPAMLLRTLLPQDDSPLRVSYDSKTVCFTFGEYRMTGLFVDGKFPNYNSVIPEDNPKKVIVDKKELLDSLRRVSVVANPASELVKFELTNGKVTISAQDIDYAMSGHETLACQYEGENIAIGFKSPFVQEILSNIDSDSVAIELSDPARPGLFLPFEDVEKGGDEDLLMLLMPMMV